jgi:hypothetical protein
MTHTDTNPTVVVDRELPAVVESVPFARDLAAGAVPGAVRNDVGRVVAGLVDEFVRKGCGPIELTVTADAAHVRVEVSRMACSSDPENDRDRAIAEIPIPAAT